MADARDELRLDPSGVTLAQGGNRGAVGAKALDALAQGLTLRGLQGEEGAAREAEVALVLPREERDRGTGSACRSSVPIRMSELSVQHFVFRHAFARPLQQCKPTRLETMPSGRVAQLTRTPSHRRRQCAR